LLDPVTAIAAATTAFKTIQKAVTVGQDIENVTKQMGKWYTAVSDLRKAQDLNRRPPIFKKLFASGSVEEEALQLLMHEKKIQEQEKELRTLLNFRYGHKTWEEMIEMRRKIKAQREKEIYKQIEMRRTILEVVAAILLIALICALFVGIIYVYVNNQT